MTGATLDVSPCHYFIKYPHFTNHHVGAYCIRPENIRVDKLAHSGVCDTPLHGHFAELYNIL